MMPVSRPSAPTRPVMVVAKKSERPSKPAGPSWIDGSGGAGDRPVLSSLRSVFAGRPQQRVPTAKNFGGIEPTKVVHIQGVRRVPVDPEHSEHSPDRPQPPAAGDGNPCPADISGSRLTVADGLQNPPCRVRAPRIHAASIDRHEETMRRLHEENQRALAHYSERPPSERRRSHSSGQSPSSSARNITNVSGALRRPSTPDGRGAPCSSCGSPIRATHINGNDNTAQEGRNDDGVPARIAIAIYGPRGSPQRVSTRVPTSDGVLHSAAAQVPFQEPRSITLRSQSPLPGDPSAAAPGRLIAPRPSSPYRSVPITKGSLPAANAPAGVGRGHAAIASVSIRTLLPLEVTEVPTVTRSRSSSPLVGAHVGESHTGATGLVRPSRQEFSRPTTPTRSGSIGGDETIPSSRVPRLSPPRKATPTRQGPSGTTQTVSAWGDVQHVPSGSGGVAFTTTPRPDDVPSLSPSTCSEAGGGSPPKARSLSPLALPREPASGSMIARPAWSSAQMEATRTSIQQPKFCWSCGERHAPAAVVRFCSSCGARVL